MNVHTDVLLKMLLCLKKQSSFWENTVCPVYSSSSLSFCVFYYLCVFSYVMAHRLERFFFSKLKYNNVSVCVYGSRQYSGTDALREEHMR